MTVQTLSIVALTVLLATAERPALAEPTGAGSQNDLTLRKGALNASAVGYSQVVAVENTSPRAFSAIQVECGFFAGDTLVNAVFSYVQNLKPGTTGFVEVTAFGAKDVTRAECRIVNA